MEQMQLRDLTQKYVEFCKEHKLNPQIMREILLLRNQGLNNTIIANTLGISRITVNYYVNKLNELNLQDLVKLIILVGLIYGGLAVLSEILK